MSPMQCQDMEKFIHVYLDREFAEEDRADYERHLTSCPDCRRLAQFEQRFKQQLKTSLARPRLALDQREEVRARIMQTIANAPPAPAQQSAGRWALRVVPAAAAAGLLLTLLFRQEEAPSLTAHHALLLPGKSLFSEVESGDPLAVKRWYRDKLGFPIEPPQFRDGRTALTGGRIGHVDARRAAHLVYKRGDQRISVMMFRPSLLPTHGMTRRRIGNKTVFFSRQSGVNVAQFHHEGLGYTITGSVSPHDLDSLVRDVLGQNPTLPSAPPSSVGVPVSTSP